MVWDWIVLRYVFHHHFFICCQGLVSKCFLSTIYFHLYFGIMSNFPTFPLNWLKLPKLTLSLSGKSIFVCVIEVLVDVWFDIHRSLVNKILSGNQEKEIPVWHFEDEWCFFFSQEETNIMTLTLTYIHLMCGRWEWFGCSDVIQPPKRNTQVSISWNPIDELQLLLWYVFLWV